MHKIIFWHGILNILSMEITEDQLVKSPSNINPTGNNSIVIPVMKEEVLLSAKTVISGGVRIEKKILEQEVLLEVPLVEDDIEITTVPVNRFTDTMPDAVRYEGDTMIITVLKEVQVVRMMIEKEIHITKRKVHNTDTRTILLRQEDVTVYKIEPNIKN